MRHTQVVAGREQCMHFLLYVPGIFANFTVEMPTNCSLSYRCYWCGCSNRVCCFLLLLGICCLVPFQEYAHRVDSYYLLAFFCVIFWGHCIFGDRTSFPPFFPGLQMILIRLQYFGVMFTFYCVIQDSVICKETNFWFYTHGEVTNVYQKEQRASNKSLWHSTHHQRPLRMLSTAHNALQAAI